MPGWRACWGGEPGWLAGQLQGGSGTSVAGTCRHGMLTVHVPQPASPDPHFPLPTTLQVRAIPPDRLLLESDSPDGALDLPPAWQEALPSLAHLPAQLESADLRQLNRPCVLRWTLQLVAAMLGKSEEEVAAITWENARRVFYGGCDSEVAAG